MTIILVKLIAGLGNPGEKYVNNRHNIGFAVCDFLAKKMGDSFQKSADLMCDFFKKNELVVIKPSTFVNESGQSVSAVAHFYKIGPEDILVIHDDMDLEFGRIRLAFNGSSAGHNGVKSVIAGLGAIDFGRLRIGIGSPRRASGEAGRPVNPKQMPADFVLEDFTSEQAGKLPEIISRSYEAVMSWLEEGIEATMNKFN